MAFPDTITVVAPELDSGTSRSVLTLQGLANLLTPLLGALASAAESDPDAASANINSLLRGILENTGNGVVLTDNMVKGTTAAMTGTASTQVIAAGGAGVKNCITNIIVANDHSTTDTLVQILDGNAGTVMAVVYSPAKSTVNVPLLVPLVGTAATRVDAKNVTNSSSVTVTLTGYRE